MSVRSNCLCRLPELGFVYPVNGVSHGKNEVGASIVDGMAGPARENDHLAQTLTDARQLSPSFVLSSHPNQRPTIRQRSGHHNVEHEEGHERLLQAPKQKKRCRRP